jgi:molybdopterin-synthase adenylyltransferase
VSLSDEVAVRLRRSVNVLPRSHDVVDFYRGHTKVTVQTRNASVPLIRALVEGATSEGLATAGAMSLSDAATVLETLAERRFTVAVPPHRTVLAAGVDAELWDRQLGHFADLEGIDPLAAQAALMSKRVIVFGVGSLGSWTLQHLTAMGVRDVVLIDYDSVCARDLPRQTLFSAQDVGALKVVAARDWLVTRFVDASVSSHVVRVTCTADLVAVIEAVGGADLLVQTADEPPWKASIWAAQACRRTSMAHIRGTGWTVGPLTRNHEDPCLGCQWLAAAERDPDHEQIVQMRALIGEMPSAALSTTVARVGATLAEYSLYTLLATHDTDLVGKQLIVAGPTAGTRMQIDRHPKCPVCSDVADPEWAPYA